MKRNKTTRNTITCHPLHRLLTCVLLTFSFALLLTSCQYQDSKQTAATRTLTDGLGRKVVIRADKPLRIMALSAALTEMLFATLPDSEIVGVSHACNYPADKVKSKPKVNTYPVDFEKLVSLRPDLVLAEEGIVSFETAAQLERLKIPIYFFKYNTLADIWSAMDTIGMMTGHAQHVKHISDSLRAIEASYKALINGQPRPKVLCLVSDKPIYAWGSQTIMTAQLALAGGTNAITERFAKAYPELSREYVLKLNPDIIFGGDMRGLDSSFFNFYPELKTINAYRRHQCYKLDADITTRPGPRSLQSVAIMEAIIKQAKF